MIFRNRLAPLASRRHYSWLPSEENWRIGFAWRQFRWYPKFLFRVVEEMGYGSDLNQMVEISVWLSSVRNLDKTALGHLVQKELRAFFRAMGIHKRAGQWSVCEFPRNEGEKGAPEDPESDWRAPSDGDVANMFCRRMRQGRTATTRSPSMGRQASCSQQDSAPLCFYGGRR